MRLDIEGLNFTYRGGVDVLHDINLTLEGNGLT